MKDKKKVLFIVLLVGCIIQIIQLCIIGKAGKFLVVASSISSLFGICMILFPVSFAKCINAWSTSLSYKSSYEWDKEPSSYAVHEVIIVGCLFYIFPIFVMLYQNG